jgi:hypothetical protein
MVLRFYLLTQLSSKKGIFNVRKCIMFMKLLLRNDWCLSLNFNETFY